MKCATSDQPPGLPACTPSCSSHLHPRFSRTLTATLSPVRMWRPSLTLPNVPGTGCEARKTQASNCKAHISEVLLSDVTRVTKQGQSFLHSHALLYNSQTLSLCIPNAPNLRNPMCSGDKTPKKTSTKTLQNLQPRSLHQWSCPECSDPTHHDDYWRWP